MKNKLMRISKMTFISLFEVLAKATIDGENNNKMLKKARIFMRIGLFCLILSVIGWVALPRVHDALNIVGSSIIVFLGSFLGLLFLFLGWRKVYKNQGNIH